MRKLAACMLAFAAGFLVSRAVDFSQHAVWAGDDGPKPECPDRVAGNVSGIVAGDVNGDGRLNVTDPVYLLNFIFTGGPEPTPRPAFAVKTVILTRHAEKEGGGANPPLAPAGVERARVFAGLLENIEVDVFIASERDRTIDTLVPLAEARGVAREDIEQIPEICDVVDRVDRLDDGATAVIAHHSFTLHQILDGLGVEGHEDISLSGNEHDNWFIVEIPVDAPPELLHLRYPAIPEPPVDPAGDPG